MCGSCVNFLCVNKRTLCYTHVTVHALYAQYAINVPINNNTGNIARECVIVVMTHI